VLRDLPDPVRDLPDPVRDLQLIDAGVSPTEGR
jgi:hypothetical protein